MITDFTPHGCHPHDLGETRSEKQADFTPRDDLFHHRRIFISGFALVGMNLEIILSVERPVLGVELFGSHSQDEAVFFAGEARRVITAIAVDHALGKGPRVHQFRERGGEMVVLLIELALRPQHHTHVAQRRRLGLGTSRISRELGLVGWLTRRSLGRRSSWRTLSTSDLT